MESRERREQIGFEMIVPVDRIQPENDPDEKDDVQDPKDRPPEVAMGQNVPEMGEHRFSISPTAER